MQVWNAAADLQVEFTNIDHLVAHNLRRVQAAMRRARLGPQHFSGSTGYGHGDLGRAVLDEVRSPLVLYVAGLHAGWFAEHEAWALLGIIEPFAISSLSLL